uniref:GIY-YIG domain-containing protein n=1 Tax=Strongyloides papillosus TaxID=174720 RepID=A0A0N5BY61_STREA
MNNLVVKEYQNFNGIRKVVLELEKAVDNWRTSDEYMELADTDGYPLVEKKLDSKLSANTKVLELEKAVDNWRTSDEYMELADIDGYPLVEKKLDSKLSANTKEEKIGETITEKSYTSCGLRRITLRFNGTRENLVWKTSQEYIDLAEPKGLLELRGNRKQQISRENDSKGHHQLYCIILGKENDTERLLYVGKGNSRRYETHCSEIRRQVKNLFGKNGEEHVINLNTTYSKYLAIAILLLKKRKIIFQTIKNYENEQECLEDESILIRSRISSWQNMSRGVIMTTHKNS